MMMHVVLMAMKAYHMMRTLQCVTTVFASLTSAYLSSWPSAPSSLLTYCVHVSKVNTQSDVPAG
jgi:hypothetical protein